MRASELRVGRRLRAGAMGLAGILGLAAAVAFGAEQAHPARDVQLASGAAWLVSGKVGQLTLLDGSSTEVAAQVQVAAVGSELEVVQRGSTAYSVDRTAGTIRRVDGATFEVSQPQSPIPDAHSGLTAFAADNAVYALDVNRGVLTAADPQTLTRQGDLVSLASRLTPGTSTLDSAGRLWVLDTATGDLSWASGSNRSTRRQVTKPGNALLALVNGAPVLVNLDERNVAAVDTETGVPGERIPIDLRTDDSVRVSGSAHDSRLYVVASRGLLTICDLAARSCNTAIPLAGNSDFGAPVEAGQRLFVPDYASGQVWIVNLSDRTVVAKPEVLKPAGQFQLLSRDGIVFYNDPNTERAGVIQLDGTVKPVAKYDPQTPDKGLNSPPPPDSTPPATPPPAPPPTNEPPPSDPNPSPPNRPPPPPDQTAPRPPPPQPPTQQPPVPNPPPSQPPPSEPPQPPVKPELRVTLSTTTPVVNEDVTLKVDTTTGVTPTSATWTFGDSSQGGGDTVTHRWAAARTYQVGVQATMPDGQTATTSVSITVSEPAKVPVPNVVGRTEAQARAQIEAAGLVPAVRQAASSTVPVGAVIDQTPAGGSRVDPGSTVTITVSLGSRVDLFDLAPNARWWIGGAQKDIPFGGPDTDPRGFAMFRSGAFSSAGKQNCRLEDGTAPQKYLQTTGDTAGDFIVGQYTLATPVAAGDRLRATAGFIRCGNYTWAGQVEIRLWVGQRAYSVFDNGTDGVMQSFDIDLTPHVGETDIKMQVAVQNGPREYWVGWVNPRIERG